MRKIFVVLFCIACLLSQAKTIDPNQARIAAVNYLSREGLLKNNSKLTINKSYIFNGFTCLYVFDIDTTGFILVSADDRTTPILGYSCNGRFDAEQLPTNFSYWVDDYCQSIAYGIEHESFRGDDGTKMWKDLLSGNDGVKGATKNVNALIETQWGQGYGYYNYCPVYGWGHSVVGCGATAMAQIIRHYQYPTNGFGSKLYYCSPYGTLSADFFESTYDYSLMPTQIDYYSSDDEIDAVAQLSYHCGVALSMTYESDENPGGSSSQCSDVPDAFTYFGYFTTQHVHRSNDEALWVRTLREELDNGRPIFYCGYDENLNGHAFICDGYLNNGQTFHFNWGWDGYCDGFYTLNTMVDGLTERHEVVLNIQPSGFASHTDVIHIALDGTGDGSSWEAAHHDLHTAVTTIVPLIKKPIWIKSGLYTGDTNNSTFLEITNSTKIYGGFAGNESDINQRDIKNNPTILDGQNRQSIIYIYGQALGVSTTIDGFTIQNGVSTNRSVFTCANTSCEKLTFINNRGYEHPIIAISNSSTLSHCVISNNRSNDFVISANKSKIKNSLIANNEGNVFDLTNTSQIFESTITSNFGDVISTSGSASSIDGCIIWNNSGLRSYYDSTAMPTINYSASDHIITNYGTGNIDISSFNNLPTGPRFVNPSLVRGCADTLGDWHLADGSPCINSGAVQVPHQDRTDLDGNNRIEGGRADIGCYESSFTTGISEAEIGNLLVYPNPTSEYIRLDTSRPTTLSIFDAAGKCLLRQKVNVGQTTIDFRSYPSGIYYIQMGEKSAKIVRQ